MRKRNFVSVIFFLFLLSSCVKNENNNLSNREVVLSRVCLDEKYNRKLSYDISIVKLETSDSVLLGNIGTIEKSGNKLYISNRNGIHIFNSEGTFVKKIDKGAGPGEVQQVIAMNVNEEFRELTVVDAGGWLKLYDLDGNYLKQYYTNILMYDAIRLNANTFALHSGYSGNRQKKLLYFFDTKSNKIVKKSIPISNLPLKNLSILTYNNFTRVDDYFLYYASNSRTVYRIDTLGNTEPFNILDFGILSPPQSYIEKFKRAGLFMREAYEDNYLSFITYYYKFKELTLIGFNYKSFNCGVIDNKDKSKLFLASTFDLFGFPKVKSLSRPKNRIDNSLVFALEPSELFVDFNTSDVVNITIGDATMSLNSTSNPLLVFVVFR